MRFPFVGSGCKLGYQVWLVTVGQSRLQRFARIRSPDSIFKSENNRGRAGNVDSKFEVLDELGAGMAGYI
jgi:hypothetical protein